MGVSVTFLILQYVTVRHTRASERTESRHMQELTDRRKKRAIRADKGIRAWSSWERISRTNEKDAAIVGISDRLERISRSRGKR